MGDQKRRGSAVLEFEKVATFKGDDEIIKGGVSFNNPLTDEGEEEGENYAPASTARKSAYFEFDHLADYANDDDDDLEHTDNSMFVSEADKDVINNAISQMEVETNTRKQLKEQLHASTTRITVSAPSDCKDDGEGEFDDPPPTSSNSQQQETYEETDELPTGGRDRSSTTLAKPPPPGTDMFSLFGGTIAGVAGGVAGAGGAAATGVYGVLGTAAQGVTQGVTDTTTATGQVVGSTVSGVWTSVSTGGGFF
mmetsp:Transcript_17378/g.20460  ORF Transcript_17378/g.20460 Transcript_17378/m.20460 type:complete len:252 (+) Transcript_17378:121-876(+)|eukprot:CAMPEP_0114348258 /NCGR_PEP_ID=MMETSP0101-20121206/14558_1 /TAXON_ID=38822 ORGANISM="Pteridomonas danica, Strain PT" /NCGR_SAMPLE_ID=MMETSP0101 /ASSEMBLY_ACC=CAM_ASM_000211 /LENGTH=251 /DNA_ID=CAMNT_0001486063 /DNA_START=48 /DNA_END=803 /DNA_ORIENTATION=-